MDFPENRREVPKKEIEKKVEKIVSGEVQRRKKPMGKRFAETMIQGEASSVWSYVINDILVPAAKDTVADVFTQGVERMLFGEARSTSRRGHRGGSSNHINYSRFSTGPVGRRDDSRSMSRRARASHNFDEIILDTRVEAETVLERLFDLISQFEEARVADLYDLVGITGDYTDAKWGWTDLRGADITRVRNGYLLDLPRAVPLD